MNGLQAAGWADEATIFKRGYPVHPTAGGRVLWSVKPATFDSRMAGVELDNPDTNPDSPNDLQILHIISLSPDQNPESESLSLSSIYFLLSISALA